MMTGMKMHVCWIHCFQETIKKFDNPVCHGWLMVWWCMLNGSTLSTYISWMFRHTGPKSDYLVVSTMCKHAGKVWLESKGVPNGTTHKHSSITCSQLTTHHYTLQGEQNAHSILKQCNLWQFPLVHSGLQLFNDNNNQNKCACCVFYV